MTTITLAQVAERAGVSTATVSMVLRNRGVFHRQPANAYLKRWMILAMSITRPQRICVIAAAIRSGSCCMTLLTHFMAR